ncbi:NUDIX hydrolase [Candidatus Babeliales bacterium]|nr:NUDIX hydrolase [Candidatus Babeliales bacterium]
MKDELLDIVDKYDKVIGQKFRSEIYLKKLSNFRVVNAFLINKDGKLWIPRRAKNKRVFPLCLDASMGGHVASGETYEEALTRELMEELRIDVKHNQSEYIGSLNPHEHNTSAFMRVYLLKSKKTPNYNPNDFIESFWLFPKELLNRINFGDKGKDDLPIIIKNLF